MFLNDMRIDEAAETQHNRPYFQAGNVARQREGIGMNDNEKGPATGDPFISVPRA